MTAQRLLATMTAILLMAGGLAASAPDYPELTPPVPYDALNSNERKLWHWYQHGCYGAIEEHYPEYLQGSNIQQRVNLTFFAAAARLARGDYDGADDLLSTFLAAPLYKPLLGPNDRAQLLALSLVGRCRANDQSKAIDYYRELALQDLLPLLPAWALPQATTVALFLRDSDNAIPLIMTYLHEAPPSASQQRAHYRYMVASLLLQKGHNERAHDNFLIALEEEVATPQVRSKALRGLVAASQRLLLDSEPSSSERLLLAQRLVDEIDRLLKQDPTLNDDERIDLRQQRLQVFTILTRQQTSDAKALRQLLAEAQTPAERAKVHLMLALEAYRERGDAAAFHAHAQQALTEHPALTQQRSLHQILFHVYHDLSRSPTNTGSSPWHYEAALHLTALYGAGDDEAPEVAPHHAVAALDHAAALYGGTEGLRELTPMSLVPEKVAGRVRIINDLYLIAFSDVAALRAHRGDGAVGSSLKRAVVTLSASRNIPALQQLAGALTRQQAAALDAEQALLSATLAYQYTRSGAYDEATRLSKSQLNAQEQPTAQLAALAFASAGWRALARDAAAGKEQYLPYLELLAALAQQRDRRGEPLYAEAAIEYGAASAARQGQHPDSHNVRAMLLSRVKSSYFDDEAPQNHRYLQEARHDAVAAQALDDYGTLLEAHTFAAQCLVAKKHNDFNDMLTWQRQALERYDSLLKQPRWQYVLSEAEAGKQYLVQGK